MDGGVSIALAWSLRSKLLSLEISMDADFQVLDNITLKR
jgi:hypothetical protein